MILIIFSLLVLVMVATAYTTYEAIGYTPHYDRFMLCVIPTLLSIVLTLLWAEGMLF